MKKLNLENSSTFYGRSISYDGIHHIVQSSNPPCTDLNDLDSCCSTSQYKIVREEWDHFNTNNWCDENHADNEILEFVPRRGLFADLENRFLDELNSNLTFKSASREYWTYISGVTESTISIKLCTGETLDIPREAVSSIDFFGKTKELKTLVLARLVFSQSPSGRITESLANKLKAEWEADAEVVVGAEDFIASNDKMVSEFTIPCSGPNCKPRDISHASDNWIISRAKIIKRKFVRTTPVEIWGGDTLTFIATPSLNGSPCSIIVRDAQVKVRVEYTLKE